LRLAAKQATIRHVSHPEAFRPPKWEWLSFQKWSSR